MGVALQRPLLLGGAAATSALCTLFMEDTVRRGGKETKRDPLSNGMDRFVHTRGCRAR